MAAPAAAGGWDWAEEAKARQSPSGFPCSDRKPSDMSLSFSQVQASRSDRDRDWRVWSGDPGPSGCRSEDTAARTKSSGENGRRRQIAWSGVEALGDMSRYALRALRLRQVPGSPGSGLSIRVDMGGHTLKAQLASPCPARPRLLPSHLSIPSTPFFSISSNDAKPV